MLSITEMLETAKAISYKDWSVRLKQGEDTRLYLQVSFIAEDMANRTVEEQKGRKWYLSQHMTKSEIVSTAFKAILTAEEHEARESFRYKGKAIFGPHFDVDQLVEFARSLDNIDVRTGGWVKVA